MGLLFRPTTPVQQPLDQRVRVVVKVRFGLTLDTVGQNRWKMWADAVNAGGKKVTLSFRGLELPDKRKRCRLWDRYKSTCLV
jgi:hypothetical protein